MGETVDDGMIDPKQENLTKTFILGGLSWILLLSILILHFFIFYESDIAESKKENSDLTQTSWFPPLFCFVICWVFYTAEWTKSSTFECLKHLFDAEYVVNKIKQLQQCTPNILWNIECYHIVTSRGPSPAQRRNKKVVTHRVSMKYEFDSWKDVSAEIGNLENYPLITLKLLSKFNCGNDYSLNNYNNTKKLFKTENDKDKKQTFKEQMILNEKYDTFMLVETQPGGRSQWINSICFAVFSCLLCSVCYRHWLKKQTTPKEYILQKEIYTTV
eukprot:487749_1